MSVMSELLTAGIYSVLFVVAMTLLELSMGRKWGTWKLRGVNSTGLLDIYTLSHVIHGCVFFYLYYHLLACSIEVTLLMSMGTECLWEVFENTPFVINRYRRTCSEDYKGDTILNSVSDVFAMVVGFVAAYYLPAHYILISILVFELTALWYVRDNLCLNIIMLIYPFPKIREWQMKRYHA